MDIKFISDNEENLWNYIQSKNLIHKEDKNWKGEYLILFRRLGIESLKLEIEEKADVVVNAYLYSQELLFKKQLDSINLIGEGKLLQHFTVEFESEDKELDDAWNESIQSLDLSASISTDDIIYIDECNDEAFREIIEDYKTHKFKIVRKIHSLSIYSIPTDNDPRICVQKTYLSNIDLVLKPIYV